MGCECASLRMDVLSQKSEILSQRSLMVQWFETLMTELQDVKKQNSELKELFNASNRHQKESMVVHSEPTILEGFSINGSLETNGQYVKKLLECQPEFPHETSNPFVKLFDVDPELEEGKLLVETGFQLTEDDQKIFPPEIEPAEVNSEYPLFQLERFDSAASDTQETSRAFSNEDTSTGPKNKQSKTVHRVEGSSPKRQGSDAAKGYKSSTRKIGKYRCKKCPYQTWNRSTLKAHSLNHTGEKPFQCSVCNKSFPRKQALLRHNLTHTGEKPFKCKICKNSFTTKQRLVSHNLTHTGEKPFKCTICKKSFTTKGSLVRHSWIHTGEKPFKCKICKKRFTTKQSLVTHNLIHTGEKPFPCDICDYRSSEKKALIAHRRIHTGEKPFQCDQCDYRATFYYGLVNHKKRNHRQ